MVKLNKIYTRTGDDGSTGLVKGPRRPKYDLRVTAYGTVDEANAALGIARLETTAMRKLDTLLARIQNDLFDLGSDLATPGFETEDPGVSLRIVPAQVTWLETAIDHHNADLEPLRSFVLPGGTRLAACLHVARTVVRRAERNVAELMAEEADTNPEALVYLNRLSDLLFVLARIANDGGRGDVLWAPGKFAE